MESMLHEIAHHAVRNFPSVKIDATIRSANTYSQQEAYLVSPTPFPAELLSEG
jgi:hypothetical protein